MKNPIAVFARNHREYLQEAAARNLARPERFTTFRSAKKWSKAHASNEEHGTMKIYFAPVGGQYGVEYEAILHQVHLNPRIDDPVTTEILATELDSTREEGLWEQYGKGVRTLYVISHCKQLAVPFPISELIKASDLKPISENFGYSYCVVLERQPYTAEDIELYPEEVANPTQYIEGATKTVSVVVYERSPAARAACIAHYGYRCSVCGFDFEHTYGQIGQGFIHVHHLRTLSALAETYVVDPVRDLRPICPNCHAMIHRSNPPMTIEVLRGHLVLMLGAYDEQ